MIETKQTSVCDEVTERMGELLDGLAGAELEEHVADCEACRDRKFDAEQARALVGQAGADFRAPEGFVEQLVKRLEEEAKSSLVTAHGVNESGATLPFAPTQRAGQPVEVGAPEAGSASKDPPRPAAPGGFPGPPPMP